MNFSGVILAGGQSSRMGSDKSQLVYNGIKEYQRLGALMTAYCSYICVSCRAEQQHLFPEYKTIADKAEFDNMGPLTGLLSVMAATKGPWLVLACDYPGFNESELAQLIQQRNPSAMASVLTNEQTGFVEPLLGIYEVKAYPKLIEWVKSGNQSLQAFHPTMGSALVLPLEPGSLAHADTPEERANWLRRFSEK